MDGASLAVAATNLHMLCCRNWRVSPMGARNLWRWGAMMFSGELVRRLFWSWVEMRLCTENLAIWEASVRVVAILCSLA